MVVVVVVVIVMVLCIIISSSSSSGTYIYIYIYTHIYIYVKGAASASRSATEDAPPGHLPQPRKKSLNIHICVCACICIHIYIYIYIYIYICQGVRSINVYITLIRTPPRLFPGCSVGGPDDLIGAAQAAHELLGSVAWEGALVCSLWLLVISLWLVVVVVAAAAAVVVVVVVAAVVVVVALSVRGRFRRSTADFYVRHILRRFKAFQSAISNGLLRKPNLRISDHRWSWQAIPLRAVSRIAMLWHKNMDSRVTRGKS